MATPSPITTTRASSFSRFSLLAAELRLKVWEYAFAGHPRIISVRYLPTRDVCVSSAPPPPFLSVSREARYEALRHYQLFFATQRSPAHIYVNPAVDGIYLPRYRDMGYDETLRDFRRYLVRGAELDAISCIGLDFLEEEVKRPWESYDKAVLIKSFGNLRRILVVVGTDTRKRGAMQFRVPDCPLEMARVAKEFRAHFEREQEFVREVAVTNGMEYTLWPLPELVVVSKT